MKPDKEKKNLGEIGEDVAARYLLRKGYKIKHRNWRFVHKEVDIIAEKDNQLVIVEVKARTDGGLASPEEMVGRKKQKFLVEATEAYIRKYEIDLETRFDVIFVFFSKEKPSVEHVEGAFYPTY
jgi:putative endonuclease